ncbi:Crp/Fnr family transcriptional regulator [Roseobacter denitrificans]|uniref:Cyclic nucleotide-binding protein, putative n=1 Tax=Roseobacter denitrificans (strain ATCC 33942 / OCh 114) TaxID=375451 RepID=Q16C25_ROSDO|nr:Crp/Fnr family transcriptional regulator [Roseobacter denitrificans]ABG30468.1 cyclic nucleotide-binding protein, putative [Roseobacter denitrificans OCh 114]AVL53621.1 Crp/Fnr family transcriptional regulator [Roseobacter denitrificans]SFF73140.1 CRP/FNR family transcriptional regulator, anaerobic regulatory protein [Roseobacter denitrificans OCh 114]
MIADWTERFQGTAALPRAVRDRLSKVARKIELPAGAQVFGPTNIPDSLFFLYDGRIRVSQSSDTGRDIVLYRVDAGESCVLTTACMLAEEAYNAEGIAETDITAIVLPKLAFDRLVAEEEAFRKFVFAAYSRRLIDLLRVVDDVAFGHMDVRLAERLLTLAGDFKEVAATHQQLASELGTAREVISRILQDFQKREMIAQSRGRIALLDKPALKALAASA